MSEKYPTWLTGHVKEWAQKRLPTVTLCSVGTETPAHRDIVFYHWQ